MWFIIFGIPIVIGWIIKIIIVDSAESKKKHEYFLKRCLAEGLTISEGTIIWLINEEQLWIDRGKIVGYTFRHNDPRYEIRFLDRNSEVVLCRFDSPFLFTNKNEAVEKLNQIRLRNGKKPISEDCIR